VQSVEVKAQESERSKQSCSVAAAVPPSQLEAQTPTTQALNSSTATARAEAVKAVAASSKKPRNRRANEQTKSQAAAASVELEKEDTSQMFVNGALQQFKNMLSVCYHQTKHWAWPTQKQKKGKKKNNRSNHVYLVVAILVVVSLFISHSLDPGENPTKKLKRNIKEVTPKINLAFETYIMQIQQETAIARALTDKQLGEEIEKRNEASLKPSMREIPHRLKVICIYLSPAQALYNELAYNFRTDIFPVLMRTCAWSQNAFISVKKIVQ